MYQWNKLNPWPRRPWGFGQVSFPEQYEYGFLRPNRMMRSIAYIPDARERALLGFSKLPYFHVMNFDLAAQETQDNNILPTDNFVLLSLMGTSVATDTVDDEPVLIAGHFRTQFFQLTDDSGNGMRFSSTGVNGENAVGTAQKPLFFRKPYPAPNMLAILNRTANRDTLPNAVQIVAYGVKDLDATGAPVNQPNGSENG